METFDALHQPKPKLTLIKALQYSDQNNRVTLAYSRLMKQIFNEKVSEEAIKELPTLIGTML